MARRKWSEAEFKQIQEALQASPERREQLMVHMTPEILKAVKRRLSGQVAGVSEAGVSRLSARRVAAWLKARLMNREIMAFLFEDWSRERLLLLEQWIHELIQQRAARALEQAEKELAEAQAKVEALRTAAPSRPSAQVDART